MVVVIFWFKNSRDQCKQQSKPDRFSITTDLGLQEMTENIAALGL